MPGSIRCSWRPPTGSKVCWLLHTGSLKEPSFPSAAHTHTLKEDQNQNQCISNCTTRYFQPRFPGTGVVCQCSNPSESYFQIFALSVILCIFLTNYFTNTFPLTSWLPQSLCPKPFKNSNILYLLDIHMHLFKEPPKFYKSTFSQVFIILSSTVVSTKAAGRDVRLTDTLELFLIWTVFKHWSHF